MNRATHTLLSVGFLGGLHLMLAQPGAPATGGIPGVAGSGGSLPGMAITPPSGGVALPTGLPGRTGTNPVPSTHLTRPTTPYV